MIENRFLYFLTYSDFKNKLNAGLINENSIAFIEDLSLIWTHGNEFGNSTPINLNEEDLAIVNDKIQFADKDFDPSVFSGLGRKYLRKNIVSRQGDDSSSDDSGQLSESNDKRSNYSYFINLLDDTMVNTPNTVYVVLYDYDLDGAILAIPENCVLRFDGGSIFNGALIGQNTLVVYGKRKDECFKNVQLLGTWTSNDGPDLPIYAGSSDASLALNAINNVASGANSVAEGSLTTASGMVSHAEGSSTAASGVAAHAEGCNTEASGSYSHAEGYGTTASGSYSHAEGYDTAASSAASHAEGYQTKASGQTSHAEGEFTLAAGVRSHSEGYYTTASGYVSHAEGNNTTAINPCEHAEGQYNKSNTNTRHSVGIGTNLNDRKNAFEIMSDGKAFFYNIGDYNGTNPANADSLQTVIANLLVSLNELKQTRTITRTIRHIGGDTEGNLIRDIFEVSSYSQLLRDFIMDVYNGLHSRLVFDPSDHESTHFSMEVTYIAEYSISGDYYGANGIKFTFKLPMTLQYYDSEDQTTKNFNTVSCKLSLSYEGVVTVNDLIFSEV